MRLTKDEARILAQALDEYKYKVVAMNLMILKS
jgi:hypothetical protein